MCEPINLRLCNVFVMLSAMKLSDYFDREGIAHAAFARLTGINKMNISRYVNGHNTPSLHHLDLIIQHTNGEVGLHDFLPNQPKEESTNVSSSQ